MPEVAESVREKSLENRVVLRDGFSCDLAGKLWRWLNSPREPNFDDYAAQNTHEFGIELAQRLRTEQVWTVMFDGDPVGFIGFRKANPIGGEMRGMVIDPRLRNIGIGRLALRLCMKKLDSEGVRSIRVAPFGNNYPAIRMLMSVGFRPIGILRCATMRGGKPAPLRILARESGGE